MARGGSKPPANVKIIAQDRREGRDRPAARVHAGRRRRALAWAVHAAAERRAADPDAAERRQQRRVHLELRGLPRPAEVPLADDELYDWDLLAGPSGDRIVYIRFSDEPDAAVREAAIVFDQELPVLVPRFLRIGPTAKNAKASSAARIPVCGGAARRWLRIGGRDGFSGLNAVQVASDVRRPCGWRPFLPTFSYRLAAARVRAGGGSRREHQPVVPRPHEPLS